VSILNSQAGPPTLKSLDFALAGAGFLKNLGSTSRDDFYNVLSLSLGLVLNALGGFFKMICLPFEVRWHLEFPRLLIWYPHQPPCWIPRSLQQRQTAPQAASWRGRWPHEATKAQMETHFEVFSGVWGLEIGKNILARDIVTAIPKQLSAIEFPSAPYRRYKSSAAAHA